MSESYLRLIKRVAEHIPKDNVHLLPRGVRGLYVLYKERKRVEKCDVVYVGMTNASVRSRLMRHRERKRELWTHASVFAVWENVRDEEVAELEGLFRHIYRFDSRANVLNVQRSFKKLRHVRDDDIEAWVE